MHATYLFFILIESICLLYAWVWIGNSFLAFHNEKYENQRKLSSTFLQMSKWTYNARPTDFIVIEDSIFKRYVQQQTTSQMPRQQEDDTGSFAQDTSSVSSNLFYPSHLDLLNELEASDNATASTTLVLYQLLSKDQRKGVHEYIRNHFPSLESRTLVTENQSESHFLVIKKLKQHQRTVGLGAAQSTSVYMRWDKTQSEYTHFTLIKSGQTTLEALESLGKDTGYYLDRFSYLGNKDKNAVTLQRIAIWRLDSRAKVKLTNHARYANVMLVDQDTTVNEKLKLGDLEGNHFVITLRKPSLSFSSKSDIINRIQQFDNDQYFINLFGIQRFGGEKLLNINSLVGRLVLQNRHAQAVWSLLLLSSSVLEYKVMSNTKEHEELLLYLRDRKEDQQGTWFGGLLGCYHKYVQRLSSSLDALNDDSTLSSYDFYNARIRSVYLLSLMRDDCLLPMPRKVFNFPQQKLIRAIQGSIQMEPKANADNSAALSNIEMNYYPIFKALPHNLQDLFVNSLQSEVWNTLTEQRLRRPEAMKNSSRVDGEAFAKRGDMVLVNSNGEGLSSWDLHTLKKSSLNADFVKPLVMKSNTNYSRDSLSKAFYYIIKSDEEAIEYLYKVKHVVIALPGACSVFSNETLQSLNNINTSEQIMSTIHLLNKSKKEFYPGAYRHVVNQARNIICWDGNSTWFDSNVHYNGNSSPIDASYCLDRLVSHAYSTGYVSNMICSIYRGNKESTMREDIGVEEANDSVTDSTPSLVKNKYQLSYSVSSANESKTTNSNRPGLQDMNGDGGDFSKDEDTVRLAFTLPASCYATTFLASIIE